MCLSALLSTCMYVAPHVCLVPLVALVALVPEEGVRSPRGGVLHGGKPHLGAENQTLVLRESNKCYLSSPQDFFNSLSILCRLPLNTFPGPRGKQQPKRDFRSLENESLTFHWPSFHLVLRHK